MEAASEKSNRVELILAVITILEHQIMETMDEVMAAVTRENHREEPMLSSQTTKESETQEAGELNSGFGAHAFETFRSGLLPEQNQIVVYDDQVRNAVKVENFTDEDLPGGALEDAFETGYIRVIELKTVSDMCITQDDFVSSMMKASNGMTKRMSPSLFFNRQKLLYI